MPDSQEMPEKMKNKLIRDIWFMEEGWKVKIMNV